VIVIDTSVLSHAFHRRPVDVEPHKCVHALEQLISDEAELAIPGVVFQELMSGIKSAKQSDLLEESLDGFPLILASRGTHKLAARLVNTCRANGVATSSLDALIAATSIECDAQLFTTDTDFERVQECSELSLLNLS